MNCTLSCCRVDQYVTWLWTLHPPHCSCPHSPTYNSLQSKLSTVSPIHCTRYTVQGTLYKVHCTSYTLQGTLYKGHCTSYTLQGTLYKVHCKSYTLQGTLYKGHCGLCTHTSIRAIIRETPGQILCYPLCTLHHWDYVQSHKRITWKCYSNNGQYISDFVSQVCWGLGSQEIDPPHVTCDSVTCDIWHVVGGEQSLNISGPRYTPLK